VITASAAPAVLDAAPATTPANADAGSTGAFDAILILQGMAGTPDTLDAATFEAGDTTDGLAADDAGDEDSEDDLETSLAFLANLIATAAPQGATGGSAGDFAAGGEGETAHDDALPLAVGLALATDEAGDGKSDLLAGLTAVPAESLDPRPSTGDESQNLARAMELLSQPRAATAETGKAAVLTHARDPRWADDFSARVSLMVRAGESTASLAMTPVDLGPVEVNVTVKDSQATILFAASQADTRALIEASLPKLRELLASQGFNLLDASVSSGFSRSKQPAFASNNRGGGEADAPVTEVRTVRQLGLLDLYA
jgi:flagellar hook-length control protein FliK